MANLLRLDHIEQLEAETIYIFREIASEFKNPVMLYSVGKDSSVLLHLAQKAFAPGPIPFPLLHIDTGFKFKEMYQFRDQRSQELGVDLKIFRNEESIANNMNPLDFGTQKCCGLLKTQALLQGLKKYEFDAAIGGARRDEEKSRAKERIYSFRDEFGQWDPKNQRPELWNLYNGKINSLESIRAFPLSNWTELDIWSYIYSEKIPVVSLYFAREREVVVRGTQLIPIENEKMLKGGEKVEKVFCRFRTLGCSPCTGAIRSNATTIEDIIDEMKIFRISERSTRIIDHDSSSSMEDKKKEGYF